MSHGEAFLNRKNPLIIALDVDMTDQALNLAERIGDAADFYKVGMEMYAALRNCLLLPC
jgi:orotidine-5'-phosphate decarboxylase